MIHRRDSFITHRAFCDALAEESARSMTSNNPLILSSSSQFQHPNSSSSSSIQLKLQNPILQISGGFPASFPLKREQDLLTASFNFRPPEIPPWLSTLPPVGETNDDHPSSALLSEENLNPNPSSGGIHSTTLSAFQAASPHMSATALLQKAAQIGVTMSNKPSLETSSSLLPLQAHMVSNTTNVGLFSSASREEMGGGGGSDRGFFPNHQLGMGLASFVNKTVAANAGGGGGCMEMQPGGLMGMVSSLHSGAFGENNFEGILNSSKRDDYNGISGKTLQKDLRAAAAASSVGGGGRGSDGLTRDFLSLKVFPQREFIDMDDLHRQMSSSYEHQNPPPWQS